jgi:hypothetical protein
VETTLHRQLKARFGPESGGRSEVTVGGYRVDAMGPDGVLVEVQSKGLGALRTKLRRLLAEHQVRVVKPVVIARRVVRRARRDGPDLSARFSPRRGELIDVFDDLVGLASVFPHANLRIDVLAVEIDEVRISRRRRPGYEVTDRRLREVVTSITLREAGDLWALLPGEWPEHFTTQNLAERLGRSAGFAQRVAYCLRLAGAVDTLGKSERRRVYARAGSA